jgi:hypothetical protein
MYLYYFTQPFKKRLNQNTGKTFKKPFKKRLDQNTGKTFKKPFKKRLDQNTGKTLPQHLAPPFSKRGGEGVSP